MGEPPRWRSSVSVHRPNRNLELLGIVEAEVHFLPTGRSFIELQQQILVLLIEVHVRRVALLAKPLAGLRSIGNVRSVHEKTVVFDILNHLSVAFVHIFSITLDVVGGGFQRLIWLFYGVALGSCLLLADRPFVFHEASRHGFAESLFIEGISVAWYEPIEVIGGLLEAGVLLGSPEPSFLLLEGGQDRLVGTCVASDCIALLHFLGVVGTVPVIHSNSYLIFFMSGIYLSERSLPLLAVLLRFCSLRLAGGYC